jgi:hypothetical protein
MHASAFLHDIPKPIWIAAMVMGFIWFWPVGLAILAYTVGSRRWGRRSGGPGQWYNTEAQGQSQGQGQGRGCGWAKWGDWSGPWNQPQRTETKASGNAAFDEYRSETLRRLEEEQREFVDYLERLRKAKDKAEFDQFMADRRRPMTPPEPSQGA